MTLHDIRTPGGARFHQLRTSTHIPERTRAFLGAQADKQKRFGIATDYFVTGADLNDLAVLAARLRSPITNGDEARQWRARLNAILKAATEIA